jgi:HTH-type transcriptional regulator/antitoxin HigA
MKAKILRTEAEYREALAYVESLMDAEPGSPEEDELELFSVLIDRYEQKYYPIDLPDPVEAIKFRMEQEGLSRNDMRKYLGSQSKVSEILNRKRTLSLSMMRALHDGLGIPAEVLLQDPGKELDECKHNYKDYPFTEMYKRGYFKSFNGTLHQAKGQAEELLLDLFSVFGGKVPQPIYCKNSDKDVDQNALIAWQARVVELASQEDLPSFSQENLTRNLIEEVVKLSYFSQGPQMAKELLNRKGINFIILKHLSHTYLDGACFSSPSGRPIIGLTLRYDREDNFWFTLVHELAHAFLHLSEDSSKAFFDETYRSIPETSNPEEREANRFARDILIPPDEWARVKEELLKTNRSRTIREFAERLGISPAIVAGRVRWETKEYTKFSRLVGHRKIRDQFEDDNKS